MKCSTGSFETLEAKSRLVSSRKLSMGLLTQRPFCRVHKHCQVFLSQSVCNLAINFDSARFECQRRMILYLAFDGEVM